LIGANDRHNVAISLRRPHRIGAQLTFGAINFPLREAVQDRSEVRHRVRLYWEASA
jgi:hypothetical protein